MQDNELNVLLYVNSEQVSTKGMGVVISVFKLASSCYQDAYLYKCPFISLASKRVALKALGCI